MSLEVRCCRAYYSECLQRGDLFMVFNHVLVAKPQQKCICMMCIIRHCCLFSCIYKIWPHILDTLKSVVPPPKQRGGPHPHPPTIPPTIKTTCCRQLGLPEVLTYVLICWMVQGHRKSLLLKLFPEPGPAHIPVSATPCRSFSLEQQTRAPRSETNL